MELNVLLVEDNSSVRNVLKLMLEKHGYGVLEASGGLEAVDLAQQTDHHIDVVVTDVVMPNLSCKKMVEQLRRTRPGLKVVYISGYPEEIMSNYGIADSDSSFLMKPFTADTLVQKVCHIAALSNPRSAACGMPHVRG